MYANMTVCRSTSVRGRTPGPSVGNRKQAHRSMRGCAWTREEPATRSVRRQAGGRDRPARRRSRGVARSLPACNGTGAGLRRRDSRASSAVPGRASAGVPVGAGVYVVYRDTDEPPAFLERGRAGHYKGKDLSVPTAVAEWAWVSGARVLYIGKAALGSSGRRGLSKRLNEYRRFGTGEPVAHRGGRYVWQLSDSSTLLVAWRATPHQDPRAVERTYIANFVGHYGKRPFANLTS